MTQADCPNCKTTKHAAPERDYGGGWEVVCSNCFDAEYVGDPPEAVSSSLRAYGQTAAEAIEDWNNTVGEWLDMRGDK